MALTPAQQATVKADIEGDAELNAFPNNSDGAWAIAAIYNVQAVPDFVVWKSSVSTEEVRKVLVWTEYRDTAVADKMTFELMISNGVINPSEINIRQGLADIFNSPQTAATLAALIALGKRLATRIEALLATGTGTDASPATMEFEGNISYQDIDAARNS